MWVPRCATNPTVASNFDTHLIFAKRLVLVTCHPILRSMKTDSSQRTGRLRRLHGRTCPVRWLQQAPAPTTCEETGSRQHRCHGVPLPRCRSSGPTLRLWLNAGAARDVTASQGVKGFKAGRGRRSNQQKASGPASCQRSPQRNKSNHPRQRRGGEERGRSKGKGVGRRRRRGGGGGEGGKDGGAGERVPGTRVTTTLQRGQWQPPPRREKGNQHHQATRATTTKGEEPAAATTTKGASAPKVTKGAEANTIITRQGRPP